MGAACGCGSSAKDPGAARGLAEPEQSAAPLQGRTHVVVTEEGSMVQDLFPQARQALSISGRKPLGQQMAFAERMADLHPSFEAIASLGLGCVCKKGLKPEGANQDDFCLVHADGVSVFGVFDGHGPYGDDVAACVQDFLPRQLVKKHDLEDKPAEALEKAFLDAHDHACRTLDCQLSGTTATVVVHHAEDGTLQVAHVGDSRAVVCRKHRGKLIGQELTQDHIPSVKSESRRIRDSGDGQIRRLEGDSQDRVFLKGKIYPGLTTTRSIGDQLGEKAGVTCKPEVKTFTKGKKDNWQFLLVCTDGVWQKLSTQEAVDIVGKHDAESAQRAAENLATEAWNRWISEEENVVDDITVQCFFFDNPQRRKAVADAKAKAKGAKTKDKKGAKRGKR